jgi:glutamate racemase
MSTGPIIVFDSGIGGMSIYRPLKAALPEENCIYIADSVNFPYGDKSDVWLMNRFEVLARQFSELNPKLVVLACNTATTNIIDYLRANLSCPVVGVEPVIKPLSKYKSALALMTVGTASSVSTARLLKEYGEHVQVFTPKGLASAIEYHDLDQVKKNIHEIKEIVQNHHIQAIGLSCTHYPLILPILQVEMPGVVFIDPAEAVVKEVTRVLRLG